MTEVVTRIGSRIAVYHGQSDATFDSGIPLEDALDNSLTTTVVLTGSGEWVCPENIFQVEAFITGGGGGGGGVSSVTNTSAVGGGSGASITGTIGVTPGQSYEYVCGDAGLGGSAGNNAGA